MPKKVSRFQRLRASAQALLDENAAATAGKVTRWAKFVHFWVLVWRSFVRNRCPIRASALAYATLLALIPMLAVVVSITSSFLKQDGETRINQWIVKVVASVTPAATLSTNTNGLIVAQRDAAKGASEPQADTNTEAIASNQATNPTDASTNAPGAAVTEDATRKLIAKKINEYVQNTRSGALGITGSVLLIFAAISMLSRIEGTFNDIWGVTRGRSWFMRIVLYWGVLSLAPLLIAVAVGLATGPHLESTKRLVATLPFIGNFLFHFGFQILPVLVLCLIFGAFYMLMPNTKVHWGAGMVGGLAAGILFHLNNMVNVLYVSRVVSNSRIYGSLGLVAVFMIGLYFSWLILLFGAQVAYAFQNRTTYLEEKQVENINQRGREFIALRLMTLVGRRHLLGEPPCTILEMSDELCIPTRLVRQVMQTLAMSRLVVEVAGSETGYLPGRLMETITCHDILLAMRAAQGQELATRDEPTRAEVYGEYHRIQEAERKAAESVTMLALAHRAQAQIHQQELKVLPT